MACFELTDSLEEYPPHNTRGILLQLTSNGAGGITFDSFDFIHATDDDGTFAIDASITTEFTPGTYDVQTDFTFVQLGVENSAFDATFADYEGTENDGHLECWYQDFADDVVEIAFSLPRFADPVLSTDPKFFTMNFPAYKLLRR